MPDLDYGRDRASMSGFMICGGSSPVSTMAFNSSGKTCSTMNSNGEWNQTIFLKQQRGPHHSGWQTEMGLMLFWGEDLISRNSSEFVSNLQSQTSFPLIHDSG